MKTQTLVSLHVDYDEWYPHTSYRGIQLFTPSAETSKTFNCGSFDKDYHDLMVYVCEVFSPSQRVLHMSSYDHYKMDLNCSEEELADARNI